MRRCTILLIASFAAVAAPRSGLAQESDAGQGAGPDAAAATPAAAPAEEPAPPTKLVIATKVAPPFAIKGSDGRWSGFSIELWERIAEELDAECVYRETDIPGMINGLEDETYDAGVAALTVTSEREEDIDFSHPFYTTGLGIAVRTEEHRYWLGLILSLFSWDFVKSLGGLLLVLFVVGLFVWLFERRRNAEQFGGSSIEGIGSGFWWSAVTMTTVGYGDKAPATLGGRIVGLVWMFVSVVTISGFTATIASALTVSQLGTSIEGPEDLPRVEVGTVARTTSAAYLDDRRIRFESFDTIEAGLEALERGDIDAMVYDKPILRYFVNRREEVDLRVLPISFERQDYAIGLPPGSPIREDVNRVLLREIGSSWWNDILFRYLGR